MYTFYVAHGNYIYVVVPREPITFVQFALYVTLYHHTVVFSSVYQSYPCDTSSDTRGACII